jgi:hypothetical protein
MSVLLCVIAITGVEIWGVPGLFAVLALVGFTASTALPVIRAREALWRAASLALDDADQEPRASSELFSIIAVAPTALTLRLLGNIVNNVRRGAFLEANDALIRVNRALLRPEEARLLAAVRALISLGVGDLRTAAKTAAGALPTGSEELDACLGRAMVTDAWNEPERLRVIHATWEDEGIAADQDGTLARLHRLTRLRIDARFLDDVGAAEARALSSEARAVGDEDFAADLEARAHDSAYR